jgi:thiol peroxidase
VELLLAQARWPGAARVKGMTFLSDCQKAELGLSNGLLIEPLRLLARAAVVIDGDGIVRYLQVVPEVTELPDTRAAVEVAKELMQAPRAGPCPEVCGRQDRFVCMI